MNYKDDDLFTTIVSIPIIIIMFAIFIAGARQVRHYFASEACEQFAVQSGHEAKFADYTFWSFECLVKANNGKWVPLKGLRDVN